LPEGFVEREAKLINVAMGKVADMPDAARATMAQRIWSRLISPKLDKALSREDRVHSMNQFVMAQLGRKYILPSEFGVKKKEPSWLKKAAAMLAAAGQGVGTAGVSMQHLVADITGVPKAVKETPREISGREKVQEVLGEGLAYDIPHTVGRIIPGMIAAGGAGAVAGTIPKLAQATGALRAGKLGTEAAIATTPFHGEESFTGLPIEAEGAVLGAGLGPLLRGGGRLIKKGAVKVRGTPKAEKIVEETVEHPVTKKARELFKKTPEELSAKQHLEMVDALKADTKAAQVAEQAAREAEKASAKAVVEEGKAIEKIRISESKRVARMDASKAAREAQKRITEYTRTTGNVPSVEHINRMRVGETVHDILGPGVVGPSTTRVKVAAAKAENPQAKAAVESVAKVADEVTPKVLPDAVAPMATSIDDLGIRLSERELTTLSRTDMQRLAKVRLREDVTSITSGREMGTKVLDDVGRAAKRVIDKIDAADFSKIRKPTTAVKPGKASQAMTEAERQAKSRMKTKRTISKEAQEGFSATGHPKEISDRMRLFQELTETSADDVVVEKLYTGTDVDSLALDFLSEALGTASKAGDVSEIARITNLMRKIYGG